MSRNDVDFGDLGLTRAQDAAVRAALNRWEAQRRRLAQAQIRLAARENGERVAVQTEDGLGGQVTMQVHPLSYHHWGQKLGYECWSDPTFVREYLRDNPECRVRTGATKPSVRVTATLPRKVKYQKRWEAEPCAA
jgi:hypothetical protein